MPLDKDVKHYDNDISGYFPSFPRYEYQEDLEAFKASIRHSDEAPGGSSIIIIAKIVHSQQRKTNEDREAPSQDVEGWDEFLDSCNLAVDQGEVEIDGQGCGPEERTQG